MSWMSQKNKIKQKIKREGNKEIKGNKGKRLKTQEKQWKRMKTHEK